MDATRAFEAERPRLVALASRVLADHAEAEDVVQQAWLRLHGAVVERGVEIESLPAWLTTVTTRLCLDRLRLRMPVPVDDLAEVAADADVVPDPADEVALAGVVGVALQAVLDRLTPAERVALVLHDSLGFEFAAIAGVLDVSPVAARKLASRARAKVRQPLARERPADAQVVDAFMAAARGGDLDRLLTLLAPGVRVRADAAAAAAGTPERMDGAAEVAAFFDGSAHAALPVLVEARPGYAWYHRGQAMVLFDFTVADGVVQAITFRADPAVLAAVMRRRESSGHIGASSSVSGETAHPETRMDP